MICDHLVSLILEKYHIVDALYDPMFGPTDSTCPQVLKVQRMNSKMTAFSTIYADTKALPFSSNSFLSGINFEMGSIKHRVS